MSNYELIIFDWDGTVVNSINQIVSCLHASADAVGLPATSDAVAQSIIGLGIFEAIKTMFPESTEQETQALIEAYKRIWLETAANDIEFYPTAFETIKALKDSHKIAVATGKSRAGLDRHFSLSEIGTFFHSSRCADETRSKPHPQMLLELLEEFKVKPEQALMIGDTTFDLEMAHKAKIDRIGVSYGAHDVELLKPFEPIAIIDNLKELYHWL